MAATVTATDRQKTKERTGDSSFPMQTGQQVNSAIKLRHNGKSKTASEVLSQCSAAVSRLLKAGKISPGTARRLRTKIQQAHAVDRGATK